jgi:hypothetical protein
MHIRFTPTKRPVWGARCFYKSIGQNMYEPLGQ